MGAVAGHPDKTLMREEEPVMREEEPAWKDIACKVCGDYKDGAYQSLEEAFSEACAFAYFEGQMRGIFLLGQTMTDTAIRLSEKIKQDFYAGESGLTPDNG